MTASRQYDEAWDDPLPHTLSPRKEYLRRSLELGHVSTSKPKAVVVFMHGRGDNIDDMVGVFLPILAQRFGGHEGAVDDDYDDDDDDDEKRVEAEKAAIGIVGLEARDNTWYPQSHHAKEQEADINAPYQYSSLEKLRMTLVELVFGSGIPPSRIVLVGFSQGAMLATNYIIAAMTLESERPTRAPYMPIPGHIFALAGSTFATQPPFPQRKFGSEMDEQSYLGAMEAEEALVQKSVEGAGASVTQLCPLMVKLRLRCGDKDRFFQMSEIEAAAATLAQMASSIKSVSEGTEKDETLPHAVASALQIGIGIEPGAPHQITGQMIAALVATLDEIVAHV